MTNEQRIKNLSVPAGKIDVVLDTDAYNEIDDQYAIVYLLKSKEKLNTKAIYAAPFFNGKVLSAKEGMEKSYTEIFNVLNLAGESVPVFKGSDNYLSDEQIAVVSDAAKDLAERANAYSPQNPLYVVAIGAITNVASAILLNPKVAQNTVVVWLGGHAVHYTDTAEFNMRQDIAAIRTVIKSGVPFVQLPCKGVVSEFTLSRPELEAWIKGKNALCDYLADITIEHKEKSTKSKFWSKVIWDVTAVGWLLNDDDKFMLSRVIPAPMPTYDKRYLIDDNEQLIRYVYFINKDALLEDLIKKLTAC